MKSQGEMCRERELNPQPPDKGSDAIPFSYQYLATNQSQQFSEFTAYTTDYLRNQLLNNTVHTIMTFGPHVLFHLQPLGEIVTAVFLTID